MINLDTARIMMLSLHLNNGELFANKCTRIVHGGRGDYIEFSREQIIPELVSKFGNEVSKSTDFYYFWLYPINSPKTKVYFQQKTVKYADYKIGMYYVSPDEFMDFKDPEKLF